MDEQETVAKDEEQLDHLGEEIHDARQDLQDLTHKQPEPYLFEDDQGDPADGAGPEGPGNDNSPM